MKVLVYGASGAQGGPVARQLLEAGHEVRVLTRSASNVAGLTAAGAELALGDFVDAQSMSAASRGVDGVFLHLPATFDLEVGLRWLAAALAAAESEDVGRVVFTTSSGAPAQDTGLALFELRTRAEEAVHQAGVPTAVLFPTNYLENFSAPWLRQLVLERGVLPLGYGPDEAVSWISTEDQAAFAVSALQDDRLMGQSHRIGGFETLAGPALAARVGEVLGRPVAYEPVSPEQLEQQLSGQIGPEPAKAVADAYRWHHENGMECMQVANMAAVSAAFGDPPVQGLDEHLRRIFSSQPAEVGAPDGVPA